MRYLPTALATVYIAWLVVPATCGPITDTGPQAIRPPSFPAVDSTYVREELSRLPTPAECVEAWHEDCDRAAELTYKLRGTK